MSKPSQLFGASTPAVQALVRSCALAMGFSTFAVGADSTDDAPLQEIVVTGSRIPVGAGGATTPVTIIDRDAILRGGQDTVGRILQALPFSTTAMNSNVNNGGDGSERLDLRGLSPKRTLLLLNGRRLPNGGLGGDDSVDLGTIPLGLVERIEIQTSGASAVYGADAVAGVVNVITRKAAPGFDINLKNSMTERGDGRISVAQVSGGRRIGEGDWMLGGELSQQRPVTMNERGYSAVPQWFVSPDLTLGPAGSRTTPDGRFFIPDGNALGLTAGRYFRVPGTVGQSAANYQSFDPFDPFPPSGAVFNYAPDNYLQTQNQRASIWLLGSQPIGSDVSLFVEGLWHARKSSQRLAPTPYSSDSDPAPLLADGSFGIPADNWYNPFGVPVTNIRRRLVELPPREFLQDIRGWRGLVGLQGAWKQWHWTLSWAESRSAATSTNTGMSSASRLLPAIGPSGPDASGRIVCGSRDASGIVPAANIIAGCVPVDLFDGAGSLTREQSDYLNLTLVDRGADSQRMISFGAEGPLGELPAGPVQWSVGGEYRREAGDLLYDPAGLAGVISVPAQSNIEHKSFDARELYLEARAPLLRDRLAAHSLDLAAGVRYSHFSTFGSDSTWQMGLNWQPLASWALRATFAQVFRVPDLQELYRAQVDQRIQESDDPCGNSPTAAQKAHCAANGVPGGAYQEDPLDEWDNRVGGNPSLQQERGHSLDVGLDWQPATRFAPKFSVDYFIIDLNGYIEDPLTSDVLAECANRGTPLVCAAIHRRPDGTLLRVDTVSSNFGRAVSSGYDLASQIRFEALRTHVDAGLTATYLARRDTQTYAGGDTVHGAGQLVDFTLPFPRLRASAHVEARRAAWHLSYSVQYIGGYRGCGDGGNWLADTDCYRVASRLYHDVEGGWAFSNGLELRAGITNLTDSNPPFVNGGDGNTITSMYRLLGRTYFAGLHFRIR